MKTTAILSSTEINHSFLGMVLYVIAVVIIIVLAYFTTRFVARFYSFSNKTKYIKILDRVVLAPDRSIVLLEFSGKVYMIGNDKNGVNLLDAISLNEIKEIEIKPVSTSNKKSFLDLLNGKGND